jgi:PAS domain S-box-containing protein
LDPAEAPIPAPVIGSGTDSRETVHGLRQPSGQAGLRLSRNNGVRGTPQPSARPLQDATHPAESKDPADPYRPGEATTTSITQTGRSARPVRARTQEPRSSSDACEPGAELFHAIFEEAGIGMALVDLEGRPMATNGRLRQMLGYSEDELRSMAFAEFTHPEDLRADWDRFEELLAGERERYHLDKRYMRKDGGIVYGRLTVSLVHEAGQPRYAVGMVEDLTDYHQLADERRRLRAKLATAQEQERRRIAQDIHDDPVQRLVALQILTHGLRQGAEGEDQRRRIDELAEGFTQVIGSLRALMFELLPATLHEEGFAETVRELLRRMGEDTGATYELEDRTTIEPGPAVAAAAYRILQEALRNVRTHAHARHVRLTLASEAGGLSVSVRDDGTGFEPATAPGPTQGHLGLSSMRERAELFGGWFDVITGPGVGTAILFWLPSEP